MAILNRPPTLPTDLPIRRNCCTDYTAGAVIWQLGSWWSPEAKPLVGVWGQRPQKAPAKLNSLSESAEIGAASANVVYYYLQTGAGSWVRTRSAPSLPPWQKTNFAGLTGLRRQSWPQPRSHWPRRDWPFSFAFTCPMNGSNSHTCRKQNSRSRRHRAGFRPPLG